MGDAVLECYNCGTRNVFLLGLIPSTNEGVIVMLCREPCLTLGALKDQGWDLSLWEPLIQDRAFLPYLVPPPSPREAARARLVTPAGIAALELLWRARPDATYADLLRAEADGTGPDADVPPVSLRYEDGYHYQNVFGPLVKMEADEDKASKAAMRVSGLAVRWARALNRRWTARFVFHRGPESELKLVPGDEMCIKLPSFASQFAELDRLVALSRGGAAADDDEGAWSASGFVREVRDGEVVLEISASSGDISERLPASGYTVEIVWRSVSFDRMQAALRKFAVDETSVSGYLYHALLGHAVEPLALKATLPASFSAPGLPELNPSQVAAVRAVLQRPLSLIQGPPGTGKTVTSAAIVYHLASQRAGQVLVAAPSNVAVDHLAAKIAATGLRVVRVVARSREAIVSSVDELCLHSIVLAAAGPRSELRKLHTLKSEAGELSAKDGARLRKLLREAEREVLAAADVICCTCAGAGDSHFTNLRFRQVLIDEATQAAEPECLIPIVQGCKQLVLVGDHCQVRRGEAPARPTNSRSTNS
jgi:regulator of nonsense transcripts 1